MNHPSSLLRICAILSVLLLASSLWGQRRVTLTAPGELLVSKGEVAVVVTANGDEAALGFSLVFDPTKLQFVSHAAGSATNSATIHVNQQKASGGRIGVAMMLPPGTSLPKGSQQVLRLTFKVVAQSATTAEIGFANAPVVQEVASVDAQRIEAVFAPQMFKVQP